MAKKNRLFTKKPEKLWISNADKILAYKKGDTVFAFNFHPEKSYTDLYLPVDEAGEYAVVLATDNFEFGGQGRIATTQVYEAVSDDRKNAGFSVYLPSRTAIVLKKRKKS